MPVNFLNQAERERLNRFPSEAEMDGNDLIAYFTLSAADLSQVQTHRGEANRLGFALQLGGLRYLGFCPDDVTTAPASVVTYLAGQLGLKDAVLADYGSRVQTRSQHVRDIMAYLGYHDVSEEELKTLSQWLVARALEHDKPHFLLGLAAEKLHHHKIIRPGITRLARLVAAARDKADQQTFEQLIPLLSKECRTFLDSLLEYDKELNLTRLEWLRQEATANSSKAISANLKKIDFLKKAGVAAWELVGVINPNRRKFLAGVGRKSTPIYLKQMNITRRYPVLLSLIVQTLEDLIDETLDLFIAYLGQANSRASDELSDFRLKAARQLDEKVRHFETIGAIVLSPDISDLDLRSFIYTLCLQF